MAADNSFDVISKVDVQEVKNAMDQAIKEVRTRFDLKDSHSEIKLLEGDETIELASSDQYKLKAVTEILQQKFVKRGVSLKSLDYGKIEASIQGDTVRITGKDRDTLQETIALLKGHDFGIDMQFTNYRSN